MNTERDKFLTEARGECWHEFSSTAVTSSCYKCCRILPACTFIDFSTWEGFGKLYSWCKEQEWWTMFCYYRFGDGNYIGYKVFEFIEPDRFADAVYEFLKDTP